MIKHKFLTIFLLLLLILSSLSACSDNNGSLNLNELNVELIPAAEILPTGEFTTYTVQITDKNKNPFDPDRVYLYLNMEMMNHPTEGTMERVSEGVYELALPLAMAGEWYAEITLYVGDQEKKYEGFTVQAEGDKFMEYMKGYNHDQEK